KWRKYPDIELVIHLFIPAPWVVLDFGAGYAAALRGDNRGFNYQANDARECRGYVRMTLNLDPQRESPLVGDIKADWGYTHTLKAGPIPVPPFSGELPFPTWGDGTGNPAPELAVLQHVEGKPWWWWDWNPDYTGSRDDIQIETHLVRTDANFNAK